LRLSSRTLVPRSMPEQATKSVQLGLVPPRVAPGQPLLQLREHWNGRLGQHGYRSICGNACRGAAPACATVALQPSVGPAHRLAADALVARVAR
jgi:hypothetical protein